jgi:hypothetical protein
MIASEVRRIGRISGFMSVPCEWPKLDPAAIVGAMAIK